MRGDLDLSGLYVIPCLHSGGPYVSIGVALELPNGRGLLRVSGDLCYSGVCRQGEITELHAPVDAPSPEVEVILRVGVAALRVGGSASRRERCAHDIASAELHVSPEHRAVEPGRNAAVSGEPRAEPVRVIVHIHRLQPDAGAGALNSSLPCD